VGHAGGRGARGRPRPPPRPDPRAPRATARRLPAPARAGRRGSNLRAPEDGNKSGAV
jgi:hypothetical protein